MTIHKSQQTNQFFYRFSPQEIEEYKLEVEINRQLKEGSPSRARTNLSFAGEMQSKTSMRVGLNRLF